MSTTYSINKGVNRSVEVKGIKAQYIIYLCLGFILILLMFVAFYLIGINTYVCLAVTILISVIFYYTIRYYSKKYGEHGLARQATKKRLPRAIISKSRNCFTILSAIEYEEETKNGRVLANMESRQ